MKVTERLRKDADNVWERIIEHPFVVELYSGTLNGEVQILYPPRL